MSRSQGLVTFLGVLGTALFAHVLIDVLGDHLLAHDTYDDLAHGSRGASAIVLIATLVAAGIAAARAALIEAAGDEGALLRALRAAMPRRAWLEGARVATLALPLVAAMEALDAASVGRPCDDLGDLLGGSLALGAGSTAIAAALVTGLIRLALALAAGAHGRLVRLVVSLASRSISVTSGTAAPLVSGPRRRSRARLRFSRRIRGRAPPLAPSLAASP